MNEFLQSGKITELQGNINVSYILQDENIFSLTGYKVLKTQEKNGFIKCAKLLYNGKIKLLYFTSDKKSLKNMISSIDFDTFLRVIANVMHLIIDVKNNGFLSCQNIDLAFDKIFVNPSTLAANLIYIPIASNNTDSSNFENIFRTELIKLITSTPSFAGEKASRVCSELSNGTVLLNELYKRICNECNGTPQTQQGVNAAPSGGYSQPTLSIQSVNSPSAVSFVVNKPEFVIGKSANSVDGVISFNKAVSRIHCKIVFSDNNYYAVDLGSANGTFINKVRIAPQQYCPLKSGDILRLANSDFKIQF